MYYAFAILCQNETPTEKCLMMNPILLRPDENSDDDEATISKLEDTNDKEEGDRLQKESEMSIEELMKKFYSEPPGAVDGDEAGTQFNRKNFRSSFGLKNGLRSHFHSATCLNYPILNVFLMYCRVISNQNSSGFLNRNTSQNFSY